MSISKKVYCSSV